MRIASRVCVVLASVCLLLALVAGYAERTVFDADQFANRATHALVDENVRSLIAERLTDDVVLRQQEDLLAARPLIESTASAVVGSRAFAGLFRSSVADVHRAVFQRDQDTVTLTVADIGSVIGGALQALQPKLAAQVRADKQGQLLRTKIGTVTGDAVRLADGIDVLFAIFLVLALVFMATAIALARDRRRAVWSLGVGVACAGVLLIVALAVARSYVTGSFDGPDERAAAGAVWDAFLTDLRTAAWIMAGSGAVVAAAAASLVRPVALEPRLRRLAGWIATEPERPWVRVARAVGLVLAGIVVLSNRDAVIDLFVTLVGVYLIFKGVESVLRLIYRPEIEEESREAIRMRRARRQVTLRRLAVAGIAGVLIFGAVAVFTASGGTSTPAPAQVSECNGHAELCSRPLTDVVLPSTHNAMSVPLPGWYSAEQDKPIPGQLRDGIRGLLLDTHYADRLANGNVRTYFSDNSKLVQAAERDGVSQTTIDAALRLRARVGYSGKGERGVYLCHTFCELGATPLSDVLAQINDFMVANPGEVVVIVNEDYITPKDFVDAVRKAGLEDVVYRGPTTGHWPTLRHMVDTDQRLVLLGEERGGAAPWYHPAFQAIVQDTPYTFRSPSLLIDPQKVPASCERNRGPADAPIFLINHWVSTDPVPKPSDARRVNAYAPLLRRAQECDRIRKHRVNLLAVNFYRQGDLFRVVDTLNGVG